jgi:hypothetical protein
METDLMADIGRIVIMRNPPAFAAHAAKWMTAAALAANGYCRIAPSGGSTPKEPYALLASRNIAAGFHGSACIGFGATNAAFLTAIPTAIIE